MQGWRCPHCLAEAAATADEHRCDGCGWSRRRTGRLWLADASLSPAGFDRDAVARLQSMEPHFWMRERRRLVGAIIAGFRPTGGNAVDLGCGTGGLLSLLEQTYSKVVAVDAHAALLEQAALVSRQAELVQADVCRSTLPSGTFDLIVAMDVIEHVDPDAFLSEARRLSGAHGMLLVSAPAAPALWSRMDEMAGHRCRYTRSQLAAELSRNGWQPVGYTHYQCLLFPLVWLSRALGRRGRGLPERSPPSWLHALLGHINRLEVGLFGKRSLPFGSSVLMWARPKK